MFGPLLLVYAIFLSNHLHTALRQKLIFSCKGKHYALYTISTVFLKDLTLSGFLPILSHLSSLSLLANSGAYRLLILEGDSSLCCYILGRTLKVRMDKIILYTDDLKQLQNNSLSI